MSTISILNKLNNYPVFTLKDIQRITKYSANYSKLLVYRLKKKNLIYFIEDGAYTTIDDINKIATNIITPSYLSYWYASYYKGYTEQIVNSVFIATKVRKKEINFQNYKIKFINTRYLFGYYKEKDIFIVDDNKLLIDALLRPKTFGNFEEILKVVKNANFNKDKIVSYLKIINNISLIRKVGFLLEKYRSINIFDEFDNLTNSNYIILNSFYKKYKFINKKWRIKYD